MFVKFFLIFFSCVLALAAAEIYLRVVEVDQPFVLFPSTSVIFNPDPGTMVGIKGPSRYSVNRFGVRGREFTPNQTPRILAFGGSATECLFLDDEETWPMLLENRLSTIGAEDPWVGNVGRSGHRIAHHLIQLEGLLPQYPKIHSIILLVGVNDLLIRLSRGKELTKVDFDTGAASPELEGEAFASYSLQPRFNLRLANLWERFSTKSNSPLPYVQDRAGLVYTKWRRHRQESPRKIEVLPDLTIDLVSYRQSLERFVHRARALGTEPYLITQPTLWKSGNSSAEEALLWMGGIGDYQEASGSPYYSSRVLAEGMERYNNVVRLVCQEARVNCVDLARELPKTSEFFYDDCHYNEKGARQVAAIIDATIGQKLVGQSQP